MKPLYLFVFMSIFMVGCDNQFSGGKLSEIEKGIAIIANDPHESFYELMKLKKYSTFLNDGKHGNIDRFDANAREEELQQFKKKFDKNKISGDGYLSNGVIAAEELGIFQIFHNSNQKSKKTRPQLRMPNGFIRKYAWIVLSIQKMAPFYWYKIICLLDNGQDNEAIDSLSDFVNAELLTSPTTRTVEFIDLLNIKYQISDINKKKLINMKNSLCTEINSINLNP